MMKRYNRIEDFPEMRCVPGPLRTKVARQFTRKLRLGWRHSLAIGCGVVVLIAACGLTTRLTMIFNLSRPLTILAFLAALWIGMIWVYMIITRIFRPELIRFIATLHTNSRLHRCLNCDYDLRGSISDTCPECGAPVNLEIDQAPNVE